MEHDTLLPKDEEFDQINQIYDECLSYLKDTSSEDDNKVICDDAYESRQSDDEPDYDTIDENGSITINDGNEEELINEEHKEVIEDKNEEIDDLNEAKNEEIEDLIEAKNEEVEMEKPKIAFNVVNEMKSTESIISECKSERLRKLSQQLPKIVITQSTNSLEMRYDRNEKISAPRVPKKKVIRPVYLDKNLQHRNRVAYGAYPKRLVSKSGIENVALISNVPYEKIRLLNDTFHTLINLRWRWIVTGTIVVHFAIWLVFAVFWYITALAHYDLEPDPPKRTCVTGGKDFVTIFLASVEAQTTIGFGDRAIDEECPESVFLLVMQLILGTGLSGVLTCVVYAKLTRPEKLSRDGVGFSKKAVISMRDGKLCLMMRAWDLNYDHIISSEFTAHFIHTYKTKEGEVIRYYAQTLALQHKQFLLWPITLVHVIDRDSPLYGYTPQDIAHNSYEITVSLKGASASMGTFTQSQTSYLPREVLWGHRFPTVVKYNQHKQKYAIEHHKLDSTEPVDTPYCSAKEIYNNTPDKPDVYVCPGTPGSFSDKVSEFHLERTSSFKQNYTKA